MEDKNQKILEVMRSRYACKKFDPTKTVSKADFDTILEAARLSPTSFGFEPWKMLVVQDPALKQKLYPIAWGAQNSLNGASHLVILLSRKKPDMLYDADYITHMMRDVHHLPEEAVVPRRKRFKEFSETEFNLLESDRALLDWTSKQTYIVLANMLVAATYLGIDSCPIEGFNKAAVNALLAEEDIIDLERFSVSVMAGFGYRAEEPRTKTRQSLSELVLWR